MCQTALDFFGGILKLFFRLVQELVCVQEQTQSVPLTVNPAANWEQIVKVVKVHA